jgi:uncharacterized protein YbbC (DUF1343 family)/CubicO group peptidase (beta-lactamase class C family)
VIAPLLALALLLPRPAAPRDGGLAPGRLARIDAVVQDGIARGETPGAIVLVGRGRRVLFEKAYGNRSVEPTRERMTLDTVFDVASLTKVVATTTAVMILVEEGKVRLADPVTRYLPDFAAGGGERGSITVEELMTHRAGFAPDDPIELYRGTPEEIFARKFRQPLATRPGEKFLYSDVSYEVLGELVRRVSGMRLDHFAAEHIFRPLGMRDSHFRPIGEGPYPVALKRIAPTERIEGRILRGVVHDPRARALGGVAGHAGLFSSARDLAIFCQMILGDGAFGRVRILSPVTVEAMTRPRFYGDSDLRGLGFDIATHFSSNRGDLFPLGSFGHTGFTGPSIWIDPATRTYVVFMANRVHPDGTGDVVRLRALVANVVAASIVDSSVAERVRQQSARTMALLAPAIAAKRVAAAIRPSGPRAFEAAHAVLAGIDVLMAQKFAPIAGRRIGLVTNQTGRTRDGVSDMDVLSSPEAKKAGVTLAALFSPEHGIRGEQDSRVSDSRDAKTGLPIYSLYGAARRPTPEELAGLDALVFDIQDVGARFYTYLTTLGYVLEAAARAKIPVFVLDRPDPIDGVDFAGPMPDADRLSFTAYHPIPVRTGMTVGELARLFNGERKIGADLAVVPMEGWTRDLFYDQTGLPWTDPSPNVRSLSAALLYPGIGLLEPTNVSVGRGTDTPFEVFGAPWIDPTVLARRLASRELAGVSFMPVWFSPAASVYAGERCGGVRITILDRGAVHPVALGLAIAAELRELYPGQWQIERFIGLLANGDSLARLERGESPAAIISSWNEALEQFSKIRARYLLY